MNIKELSQKIGLEEKDYRQLLKLYTDTASSDIKKLKDALESEDGKTAVEAAHSLKGASGNMALMEIYEIACSIEKNCVQKNFSGLDGEAARLESLLEEIIKLQGE